MPDAITIDRLSHSYPATRKLRDRSPGAASRKALDDVSFSITSGEIFCLLGPNGSGKSTLFRILSTILRPASGRVSVFDLDLAGAADEIRRIIGVVFQHPSLDQKLTARENLFHQGHLYHLRGGVLRDRITESLSRVGVLDRADDPVEHLSGGLQRRVELAKAMLHKPRLLILDEPSTGLDPRARIDFDSSLHDLQKHDGVTVLLTTHILSEADRCDRIAILDHGKLVALGAPEALKREIGGDVISMESPEPEALCEAIRQSFDASTQVMDGMVRIERAHGHEFIPQLIEAFPGRIESVTLAKPSLEDVFIHKTGHRFWENGSGAE